MNETTEFIKRNKVFAVIKSDNYDSSYRFAQACVDGGLKIIEIILTSSGGKELIKDLSSINDIVVGAGTVLDLDAAKQAVNLGAKFIVSPHTDVEIINFCKDERITAISGAFTSSEIVNAWKYGADFIKIFPISPLGCGYVRAIKEPLPFINIFVTGGITVDNIEDYLSSGASAVGVSTALLGNTKNINYSAIRENSKKFSKLVK